jgi:hypothetical protein
MRFVKALESFLHNVFILNEFSAWKTDAEEKKENLSLESFVSICNAAPSVNVAICFKGKRFQAPFTRVYRKHVQLLFKSGVSLDWEPSGKKLFLFFTVRWKRKKEKERGKQGKWLMSFVQMQAANDNVL